MNVKSQHWKLLDVQRNELHCILSCSLLFTHICLFSPCFCFRPKPIYFSPPTTVTLIEEASGLNLLHLIQL